MRDHNKDNQEKQIATAHLVSGEKKQRLRSQKKGSVVFRAGEYCTFDGYLVTCDMTGPRINAIAWC